MAKDDFSPEEWAGLTEEERKAHEEDDEEDISKGPEGDSTGEKEGWKAGEDAPPEGGEKKAKEEDGTERETSGDQPQGDDGGAGDDAGKAGEDAEKKPPAPPGPDKTPFATMLPVSAKIEEIDAKLQDLDVQLDNGDIDIVAYSRNRDPLLQQKWEAQMSEKINQETARQIWRYEQGLFFRDNPEYRENEFLNAALQRAFQKVDTPENAHKTGLELLQEARAMVDEQIAAITGQKPKGEKTSDAGGKTPPSRQGKRALDDVDIPKTLAGLPTADQNDTGKDEFAYLDALEGMEYERAIARLTPDQERRYLER
ncbi:MAG: hypothetical protein A4E61_00168 [Syntrophorhabdus sp. PtaB.Bin184]|nr:MAG: hypothetical protein A4E61_00168 [Syntrophorhabdus sp. PtaB.Bin184]